MLETAELLESIGILLGAVMWPIAAIVICFWFRSEFRTLLGRVVRLKIFGTETEFLERSIEQLSSTAQSTATRAGILSPEIAAFDAGVGAIGRDSEHHRLPTVDPESDVLDARTTEAGATNRILLEAVRNPVFALNSLAADIITALFELAAQNSIDITVPGSPHPQVTVAVKLLRDRNVIDAELAGALEVFLYVSNELTLGREVDAYSFAELIQSGLLLLETLRTHFNPVSADTVAPSESNMSSVNTR